MKEIIESFFKQRSLVNHQLASYDDCIPTGDNSVSRMEKIVRSIRVGTDEEEQEEQEEQDEQEEEEEKEEKEEKEEEKRYKERHWCVFSVMLPETVQYSAATNADIHYYII